MGWKVVSCNLLSNGGAGCKTRFQSRYSNPDANHVSNVGFETLTLVQRMVVSQVLVFSVVPMVLVSMYGWCLRRWCSVWCPWCWSQWMVGVSGVGVQCGAGMVGVSGVGVQCGAHGAGHQHHPARPKKRHSGKYITHHTIAPPFQNCPPKNCVRLVCSKGRGVFPLLVSYIGFSVLYDPLTNRACFEMYFASSTVFLLTGRIIPSL